MEPINQENIRDEKGRFKPGNSGNPKGCTANAKGMREYIDIKTDGMKTVVDKVLVMLEEGTSKERMFAIEWLADRRWGKAVQPVETENTQHIIIGPADDNRPESDS